MLSRNEEKILMEHKKDIVNYLSELKDILNNDDIKMSDKVSRVIKISQKIEVKSRIITVINGGGKK